MHEGSASAIPPAIQSISPKSTHHQHQRARQAQRDLIEIQVATHQPTIQQVWQEISVEISMQQSVEISTLEFWVRGLGTHTHTHTHSHARMFERVCWVIFQASFRHSVGDLPGSSGKRDKQFLRHRTRSHTPVSTDVPVASYFTTS